MGAKSIISRRRKVSNFNCQVLDELERHFTQHGQGFFEVKNQLFTTFGFSAAGPQSRNIFAVRFFWAKKFRRATNTIHNF
jgi:hypothetical protein